MVTIIVGKTASGKDSICKKLIALYNYKRIVTYTSRPKRKGEKDGVAYHFIDKEDFLEKIKEDFFAEWKSYETVDGTWYYGTALSELENTEENTLLIMTPQGYRDICKKLKNKPKCIYIYANNKTIQERLIFRGDDK